MVIQVERGQLLLPYPDMVMDETWLPEASQADREALRIRVSEFWSLDYMIRRREDIIEACKVNKVIA